MFSLFPPRLYYLLPLIGGTAWFLTHLVLLAYWLGEGRPVYPFQPNPYVPFVSDIGAYRLKPLFIVGGTVTAIAYAGTIFAANRIRYDPSGYNIRDPKWKKALGIIALIAGVVACVACICLTVFDTRRHTQVHRQMLSTTFLGIAISAMCTEAVYLDQMRPSTQFKHLRIYCLSSLAIVVCEITLSITFFACSWADRQRVAGIVEWVVSGLGAFYIWTFMGFVTLPFTSASEESESQPLLTDRDRGDS